MNVGCIRDWLFVSSPLRRVDALIVGFCLCACLVLVALTAGVAQREARAATRWRDSFDRVEAQCKQAANGDGSGVCPAGVFTPKPVAK